MTSFPHSPGTALVPNLRANLAASYPRTPLALYASRLGAFPVELALCSAVTPLHVPSSEDNMVELIAVNGRDHPLRPAGR